MEEKKAKVNINENDYMIDSTIAMERAVYELRKENDTRLEKLLKYYPNPTNDKNFMTMRDLEEAIRLDTEAYKPSTPQDEITILKCQLKHCKSYVERQNIERRINELHRKERNEIHIKQYGSANILKYNIN